MLPVWPFIKEAVSTRQGSAVPCTRFHAKTHTLSTLLSGFSPLPGLPIKIFVANHSKEIAAENADPQQETEILLLSQVNSELSLHFSLRNCFNVSDYTSAHMKALQDYD